jgi:hypothetical protein
MCRVLMHHNQAEQVDVVSASDMRETTGRSQRRPSDDSDEHDAVCLRRPEACHVPDIASIMGFMLI